MPDAARLVAAICLAILAFIVSGQIVPLMPESTDFGYFLYVNIVLGAGAAYPGHQRNGPPGDAQPL